MPSRPSSQHIRSLSTNPKRSESPANRVSRAISTSALQTMAAVANVSRQPTPSPRHTSYNDEDEHLSTIPDPRSRTMSPANGTPPSPTPHPDLSSEVATLSNKLINAINYQTNLDDTLSVTRHELDAARERIRQLEQEAKNHNDQIVSGLLVKSSVVGAERTKLLKIVTEEKKRREETEKEKKKIEQELENLSQALFEEANKMVVTAREEASKDHELVQRKNDQLKAQLADTESLLKSHQEQLAELKQLMEQMNAERDEQANSSAPPTPGNTRFDSKEEQKGSSAGIQPGSGAGDISPTYPTSFTNLIQPVLRTDLASFDDFSSLLRMSKNHAAGSRVSSGTYGSIGIGLGLTSSTNQSPSSAAPSNGSTTSINTFATIGSSPATPTTPASTVSSSSTNNINIIIPLKETRFYKRALAEDIEPTLRLDTAPGLSWLARRTVLNAMCEGTLVVEPMPATSTSRVYVFACSLCGETRKDPTHVRTHRFRTSESDSAQRYPLCKYCLGRVRSSCDFLGFLRMLKDGHWRTDDEESERAAWEESVRLREQMFWSRIGGGVIPASQHANHTHDREKSPQTSEDARNETETMQKLGEEADMTGEIQPKDITPVPEALKPDEAGNTAFLAQRRAKKQLGLGNDTADGLWDAAQADAVLPDFNLPQKTDVEKPDGEEKDNTNRDSTQSLSVYSDAGEKETKRLSITIPESFE